MKQVHMVLQGKGGVGKSYVASLLAQHFSQRQSPLICLDTDPVNATFAGYAAFQAKPLELMNGDDLDPRAFDALVEIVMGAPDDATVVIDNGAATFVPLSSWLAENDVIRFLSDAGAAVTLHSVLTGGQAVGDTMSGLASLLRHFTGVAVVVWLNEYFGKPQWNGVPFEKSKLYDEHADQIHALIRLPVLRRETFGHDLEQVLKAKKTFAEAAADPALSIMARQRLAMIWRTLNEQMTAANL